MFRTRPTELEAGSEKTRRVVLVGPLSEKRLFGPRSLAVLLLVPLSFIQRWSVRSSAFPRFGHFDAQDLFFFFIVRTSMHKKGPLNIAI